MALAGEVARELSPILMISKANGKGKGTRVESFLKRTSLTSSLWHRPARKSYFSLPLSGHTWVYFFILLNSFFGHLRRQSQPIRESDDVRYR